MSSAFQKLRSGYTGFSILFVNVLLAIVILNVAVAVGSRVRDRVRGTSMNYAEVMFARLKQRAGILPLVYPDLDASSVQQLLNETWTRPLLFEPYTQFKEAAFKGKYVNVSEAGFRLTRDQGPWPPDPSARNVFLFGGSTTFGYGVPDGQTIASYLQDEIRRRGRGPVYVYNFGRGYFRSTQERILFQEQLVRGLRPSLAIFIDGLNEFARDSRPDFTPELDYLFQQMNGKWYAGLAQAASEMPMFELAKAVSWRFSKPVAASATDDVAALDERIVRYLENKRQIESVARDAGIPVMFVWQPVPWYKFNQKFYLFADDNGGDASTRYFRRDGYPRMRQKLASAAPDPNFEWCADIQESLAEPFYVDRFHYTAAASRRLAGDIMDRLVQRGLAAGAPR